MGAQDWNRNLIHSLERELNPGESRMVDFEDYAGTQRDFIDAVSSFGLGLEIIDYTGTGQVKVAKRNKEKRNQEKEDETMTAHNYAEDYAEFRTLYGRKEMELHHKMVSRNDYPANDCGLYVNIGNMVRSLADDWANCESNIARIAINQKANELMHELCDLYECVAVRAYAEYINGELHALECR